MSAKKGNLGWFDKVDIDSNGLVKLRIRLGQFWNCLLDGTYGINYRKQKTNRRFKSINKDQYLNLSN